jgi:hypothetical protein
VEQAGQVERIVHSVAEYLESLSPVEIVADTPVGAPGILYVFLFVIIPHDLPHPEPLEDRIAEALWEPETRVSVWIISAEEWRRVREQPAHTARHVYLHGQSFLPAAWRRSIA